MGLGGARVCTAAYRIVLLVGWPKTARIDAWALEVIGVEAIARQSLDFFTIWCRARSGLAKMRVRASPGRKRI